MLIRQNEIDAAIKKNGYALKILVCRTEWLKSKRGRACFSATGFNCGGYSSDRGNCVEELVGYRNDTNK